MVLLPTLIAAAYYYLLAADRYAIEFQYTVLRGQSSRLAPMRSRADTDSPRQSRDSYVLVEYLRSAAAFATLAKRIPIRRILAGDGGNIIRGYRMNLPVEIQLGYWNEMLDARFDPVTGITTIRIEAFRPEDSYLVASTVLELLKIQARKLSESGADKAMRFTAEARERAELQLKGAIHAVEAFQRTNPSLQDSDNGVVDSGTMAQFERLRREYQIALQSYQTTRHLDQETRARAFSDEAIVRVFSPPVQPVVATLPIRWLNTLFVTAIAFMLWVIGRIYISSATPA